MTEPLSLRVHRRTVPRAALTAAHVIQREQQATTLVSAVNPAKRFAAEKEEQGSERSFRCKAEAEPSGLCDDAIPWHAAEG